MVFVFCTIHCAFLFFARTLSSSAAVLSFFSLFFCLRAMCLDAPSHIAKIVASLTGSLSSLYEQQRVVTCSFFAEV